MELAPGTWPWLAPSEDLGLSGPYVCPGLPELTGTAMQERRCQAWAPWWQRHTSSALRLGPLSPTPATLSAQSKQKALRGTVCPHRGGTGDARPPVPGLLVKDLSRSQPGTGSDGVMSLANSRAGHSESGWAAPPRTRHPEMGTDSAKLLAAPEIPPAPRCQECPPLPPSQLHQVAVFAECVCKSVALGKREGTQCSRKGTDWFIIRH